MSPVAERRMRGSDIQLLQGKLGHEDAGSWERPASIEDS
jgi:hypothetical protein